MTSGCFLIKRTTVYNLTYLLFNIFFVQVFFLFKKYAFSCYWGITRQMISTPLARTTQKSSPSSRESRLRSPMFTYPPLTVSKSAKVLSTRVSFNLQISKWRLSNPPRSTIRFKGRMTPWVLPNLFTPADKGRIALQVTLVPGVVTETKKALSREGPRQLI